MTSQGRRADRSLRAPEFLPFAAEGWRFVLPVAAVMAACAAMGWVVAAWIAGLLMFCVAAFFRDPHRPIPGGDADVLAPADGRITRVEVVEHHGFPGHQCLRISVFLSVLDVHINRASIRGKITSTQHVPGKFLNAMNPESAAVNERNDIWFVTAWGPHLYRQIAGLIARRIVCKVGEGEELQRGERLGLIRFGSGTELYLPLPCQPLAKKGDYVRGGKTVVARMGGATVETGDSEPAAA